MKKILVIKLRAMGDTVLMTASLAELRRAFPRAEIHALALAPWHELLENHPAVDRVWSLARPRERVARLRALTRLGLQLRRERFDCVVNLHASPSSSLLSYATGARRRAIHFHGLRDRDRFSTVEIPDRGTVKPVIERDLDTLRALGVRVAAPVMPAVFPHGHEIRSAQAWLEGIDARGPLLAIGLGASRATKSWGSARFAEAAVGWASQLKDGAVLAVAGRGASEDAWVSEFSEALLRAPAEIRARVHVTQSLGIRELAAVLSRARVFLGNDSGPKHLALSVGTPTVTLFGPEHPLEWHPYPRDRHPYFFIESLSCRRDAEPGLPPWCGISECIEEKHRCMTEIQAAPVIAECLRTASLPRGSE